MSEAAAAQPAPQTAAHTLLPGRPWPLGAHVATGDDGRSGVNVAVFSQRAKKMELCLFDADGRHEIARLPMHGPDDAVFHGFLPDARPGLVYGFRAHGSHKPDGGYRFNPHKLLLDPCARALVGEFAWRSEHLGHVQGHPEGARVADTRDNAAHALKARVRAPAPGAARAPAHPRTRTREIPAGIISDKSAFAFVVLNCLLFVTCTWFINPLCFYLSPVALAVVLGYSYTKRFT